MSREQLGANCLPWFFLERYPAADAYRAALEVVATSGFALTEISHPGLLPLREASHVRRYAETVGLAIRAVHAPPMRRDPTLARQRDASILAAELGAEILVVHVSSIRFAAPDPSIRAEARERDVRRLDTLIHFCSPRGILLGLENGGRPGHPEYLISLLDALEGTARTDSRALTEPVIRSSGHQVIRSSVAVGLVFDSGHAALRGGDPLQVAWTMLPRLLHTHLHDNHGIRDEHLTPGQGIIDWPSLLDLLRQGGYTGARLLELRPRRGWQPEQWQKDLALGCKILSDP
jgi:sugar phosphate isomerase/epimerase